MDVIVDICPVVLGYILDLALGDPPWFPHPIVFFGNAISSLERRFNKGTHRLVKGALTSLLLITSVYLSFSCIGYFIKEFSNVGFGVYEALFVFFGIAGTTLIREGKAVFKVLNVEGLNAGRAQLSRIVGRDTSELTEQQIRVAVLETMSENLSDGVVAPLFWYAVAGIPGMMTYKMINTLDSMIGYKNDRYLLYGRFAAKLDDAVNYIPARITALLMAFVSLSWRSVLFILKFGNKHSSPNAGYPEAALAGILNCRFGGPNVYHNIFIDKPFIGDENRVINDGDIAKTVRVNSLVGFVSMIIVFITQFLI